MQDRINKVLRHHLYVDPLNIGFEFIPDGMPGRDKFHLDLQVLGVGTVPGGRQKVMAIKNDLCTAISEVASHRRVRHEVSRCHVV